MIFINFASTMQRHMKNKLQLLAPTCTETCNDLAKYKPQQPHAFALSL